MRLIIVLLRLLLLVLGEGLLESLARVGALASPCTRPAVVHIILVRVVIRFLVSLLLRLVVVCVVVELLLGWLCEIVIVESIAELFLCLHLGRWLVEILRLLKLLSARLARHKRLRLRSINERLALRPVLRWSCLLLLLHVGIESLRRCDWLSC
jgi:hypothetical protein